MARAYDSEVRRTRADRTRLAVIDAAAVEFADRGWFRTTMPLVAERAGVAVETVYRAVPGGKAALLAAAVQAALAGGAERAEVPTDDRPGIRRVIDAQSPAEALARYAAVVPGTWRSASSLLAVLDSAGPDESLAQLRADLENQRLDGMRRFARQLDAAGALRPGIDVATAADVLWTISSRANYHALVTVRGWTGEDYAQWLARVLTSELLDHEGSASSAEPGAS